jgi:large subunit ribosomal protein L10
MSKYVKNLITDHLRNRLEGVSDALLVDVVGLDANTNTRLRQELRQKDIHLMVVKNSLAARAAEGTALGSMFEGLAGTAAVCWGGEDLVSLAKQVVRLAQDKEFEGFEARGGMMDGKRLSAEEVAAVSRMPSRMEQLSILAGQILAPGARLSAQLLGPGGALASQISQISQETEEEGQEGQEG